MTDSIPQAWENSMKLNRDRGQKACDCYNCRAGKKALEVEAIGRRIDAVRNTFVFTESHESRYDKIDDAAAKIAAEINVYNAKAMVAAMIHSRKPDPLPADLVARIDRSNAEALAFAVEVEEYAKRPEVKELGEQRSKRWREMQYTGRAIMIRLDRMNDEQKATKEQTAAVQRAADDVDKSAKALIEMGVWDTALIDWHERGTKALSDALAAAGY